ncbi:MAG TPA: M1 family aminopeptidase [bacterium]|nr:M1 family aminopeptidase [bacterium]HPN43795.1 M1 family aminopeptidase [bacterium]
MKKLILLCGLILVQSLHAQIPVINKEFRRAEAEKKDVIAKKILSTQEYTRAEFIGWDIDYYSLDLFPDIKSETLYGRVQVRGTVLSDVMEWAGLSLWAGMQVNSIVSSANTADTLDFIQKEEIDILLIKLERPFLKGEEICFTIDYQGRPQNSGYDAFDFGSQLDKPMIWTLSEPFGAKSWWPCKDTATDKPDSIDIRVTVPQELTVVSNGSLRSKTAVGDNYIWWWHEQYPIAPYLVSLAIYEYDIHYDNYIYNDGADTMQIQFYNFPGVYEQYKGDMQKVKGMITLFSRLFGEYPFVEEKYAQADFLGGGAMEHQTCSSFSFFGEWVYVHELAHQWWGDLITCSDFHHIWLNEGLTTYCEALWYEARYKNYTASDYQMSMNLYLGPGTVYVEDPEHDNIFDGGLSYAKGSWIPHMLRHIVGDSTFFVILQEFYKSPLHSYGTATSEDFKTLCEQLSGQELETFFQQWIYEEGHPHYYYYWNWEKTTNGLYRVFGQIKQVQSVGPVFAMPLDITIQTENGDTTFVMLNDEKYTDFEYLVTAQPVMVLLDKDNWILKQVSGNFTPNFVLLDYQIDDSQMNDNGLIDAGENVTLLVQVQNIGVNAANYQLQLTTDDPDITIIDGACDLSIVERYSAADSMEAPFTLWVSPTARGHFAEFSLSVSTDNNYSQNLNFPVAINIPPILFVDDDNGKNYEALITASLENNYIPFTIWNVNENGPVDLQSYNMVIWATGSDRDSALTANEQKALAGFLNNGGKLLLTGQNIGYDLCGQGSTADSVFFRNYLHSSYINDRIEANQVLGRKDDLLGDNLMFNIAAPEGSAGDRYSPDVIVPIEPARTFLLYSTTQQCAGLYYSDDFTGAKVIYIPFGLEGISTEQDQESAGRFYKRALQWFAEPAQVTRVQQCPESPTRLYLYPNYPNPFNPETRIDFEAPERCFVTLQVFNLLGVEVAELVREYKNPGTYSVMWDGRDSFGKAVPSGVYIYKISAGNHQASQKMLLMR